MDNKLKMQSVNNVDENVKKIRELFPNCVTEGKDEEGKSIQIVDFDMLKQELSNYVVEGREERYQFNWPDKRNAILAANAPINKTLRPIRGESVQFENTKNLYIEGDNLEVLKLLQETYLGKIKMIYIDPPYNTGNDFLYEDDFKMTTEDFINANGQLDEDGNRLYQNTQRNGRYHTDWLNMIYPRIKLAADLLRDDGFIFISIDDNEVANLRKICDEIFGETNFVSQIMWKRKKERSNDSKNISIQGEYILIYGKSPLAILNFESLSSEYIKKSYKPATKDFPNGEWRPVPITVSKGLSGGGYEYKIVTPGGKVHNRLWAYPQKSYEKLLKEGRIYFGKDGNGVPQRVMYAADSKGQSTTNYWDDVATNKEGKKEVLELFDDAVFDTVKPTKLIEKIIDITIDNNESEFILDFFSGSATTADAVIRYNARNKTNHRFILVQLPEKVDGKKKGSSFDTICDIGKERIKRAITRLDGKYDSLNFDRGFRVLKIDGTNMKEVYYNPNQYEQTLFNDVLDNIKSDRTSEDLLFQVMLELGVLLSSKIEEEIVEGKKVFNVAAGYLMACFDKDVSEKTIEAVAKKKPYYFVMRDFSLANDNVATNFNQIFQMYSPDTIRKVL
ncbi:site-specific DNA-methyltransferase [Vallitalea pronyensis]|uniref:Site-specific DNA-methyltransferase n=1 Tax=Vallitalea pronyensis TaxID=1348613 RepID=A0A8J8MKX8_9FIRM|nr:site-specific DNA-methyltransferase [Vallitalea pronyensis]QUI23193.1 site-specific DNA-methyltransferase [Vallitalea pronyensis]